MPALSFHKTRLAPTPSGYLHLGNIFSFSLTASLAEVSGARILLRIDDLDRQRAQRRYLQDIFDTLSFMEIPWQEGPDDWEEFERSYSQVHRLAEYRQALEKLREGGLIFACNCSRSAIWRDGGEEGYPGTCRHKQLPLDAEGVSWRVRTDEFTPLQVLTVEGKKTEAALPAQMKDFIVRKKDGSPSYQLASLVDDIHFGIDLIVRGEDLWPSTLAQFYLASLLQADSFLQTAFYHHALLSEKDGTKMSKSAGAVSINYLRQHGKTPAAIYQDIGNTLGLDRQVTSWKELAAWAHK